MSSALHRKKRAHTDASRVTHRSRAGIGTIKTIIITHALDEHKHVCRCCEHSSACSRLSRSLLNHSLGHSRDEHDGVVLLLAPRDRRHRTAGGHGEVGRSCARRRAGAAAAIRRLVPSRPAWEMRDVV